MRMGTNHSLVVSLRETSQDEADSRTLRHHKSGVFEKDMNISKVNYKIYFVRTLKINILYDTPIAIKPNSME